MDKRVPLILNELGKLFADRNAVYKDNYIIVGKVMQALFPDGIELKHPDDFARWHLFELMIVKLTRYAVQYRSGGHPDSLNDMINYLAMLQVIDTTAPEF